MYEWYYDKMPPCFGEDTLNTHHLQTDSFIFSIKPSKGLIGHIKHFKQDFGFTDLDLSQELYSEDIKKVIDKL